VYVREGDRVKAGATLARFEAIDFESALRSAEADVTSATTAASTAQWNYDQSKDLFKVGAIASATCAPRSRQRPRPRRSRRQPSRGCAPRQSQVRDTRIVAR